MHELWYIGKDFKQSICLSLFLMSVSHLVYLLESEPIVPTSLLVCFSVVMLFWTVVRLHNFSPKAVYHCSQATKLEILKLQNNVLILFAVTTNLSTSPRLDCININQELWFTSHQITPLFRLEFISFVCSFRRCINEISQFRSTLKPLVWMPRHRHCHNFLSIYLSRPRY